MMKEQKEPSNIGIVYPSPVFGPVKSRRLGISLGINLMPADGKICSFDCIYCECGFNAQHRPKLPRPTCAEVVEALRTKLQDLQAQGIQPDVLTFAGNGEPTLHPQFAEIIDNVLALRNSFCPQAKVSVLSNATTCMRPEVKAALLKVDNNIQKLDTVSPNYIALVDRPLGHYCVKEIVAALCAFHGHVIIQTLFMKGLSGGQNVDNTTDAHVLPWLDALKAIQPEQVMVYTIDRLTPEPLLQKATPEELDRIADKLRHEGLQVEVAY